MVCWRFLDNGKNMSLRRIYYGPVIDDLAAGNSHICGLIHGANSPLHCWQWAEFDSKESNRSLMASSVAVGENFICGIVQSGQIQCLGDDNNVVDHVPAGKYSLVAAGFRHACAVLYNGSIDCWGETSGFIKPSGEFTSLALGENRGCGIKPNGTVVCWGENNFSLPVSLKQASFVALEAKRDVFCGVLASNLSLFCWGNDFLDSNSPIFDNVVPGPCRQSCPCRPLPKYADYCPEGLMICEPCTIISPGENSASLLPPSGGTSNGRRWNRETIAFTIVGCIGSLSLLMVLSFLFYKYCMNTRFRVHDSGRLEEGVVVPLPSAQTSKTKGSGVPVLEKRLSELVFSSKGGKLVEFSLDILILATNNFSEEHKIGTGSFGSVYRGILVNGSEIAIKRAEVSASLHNHYAVSTKRDQEDKDNAFLNELELLSCLNHRNLVKLIGYCDDHNERVLVYEYMDNGNLCDHLHKHQSSHLMSWPARIKVALDAARGIEYLHEYAVPPIIHRDIKSSNILLDATWTAKVSDFGLSLMTPQDDESPLSVFAAGTVGYIDPEYYRMQQLTTKSDVYSFGVVLLELLSGLKAIHRNENGVPRNIVDYIVPYIVRDDIDRVLDQRVAPPTPFEIEAVVYTGYLAADCVTIEGKNRPTMNDIVNSLERALAACLGPPALSRSTTKSSR